MKYFSIFFASILATASLSAAVPAFAKSKDVKVASYEVEQSYYNDGDEYSEEKAHPDVPDVYDDNSPDEFTKKGKYKKYKTDKNDHPNHMDKSMCVETELDHLGGKTGWHSDKYDPTHYDDKDDVEHCGYHFPHELQAPVHYEDKEQDYDHDGYDDNTGKKCKKKY